MSAVTGFSPERVQRAVRSALKGNAPTAEQAAIIESPLVHGLINAGAGSGKTAVMSARLVHLIATDQAQPEQILGLTFTNKAADELRVRTTNALIELGLPVSRLPMITTYHAFAANFLAEHALRGGFEPGSTLMTDAQVFQLIWEGMGALRFEHLAVRTNYPVRQARGLADEISNHLVDLDELIAHDLASAKRLEGRKGWTLGDARLACLKRVDLARALKQYGELKRARNRIDFGDQIRLALEVAKDQSVAQSFRGRYRVLMLDEYQDTNIAQAALLAELVGTGEDAPAVTAVGDPWQNIYAWRGANIRNILNFSKDFARGGEPAPIFPLATNFRSATKVIQVANTVLGQAIEPGEFVQPLTARPEAPEGTVEAHLLEDQESEARAIADRIQQLHAAGTSFGEMAILGRKKRLFGPLLRVLRERGIPVEPEGLGGLLEAPEVIDVLSLIRASSDPLENVALARILMGPRWRVSPFDLSMLAQDALDADRARREKDPRAERLEYSLAEAITRVEEATRITEEARRRIMRFRDRFERVKAAHHLPIDEFIEIVIDQLGLRAEIAASPDVNAPFIARNLDNLVRLASTFAPVDGQLTPAAFMSWLDSVSITGEAISVAQPSADDAVKLMTIHAAKGREFDVVFLCGLAGNPKERVQIFPDVGNSLPNPSFNPAYIPVALRGDRDLLPEDEEAFAALKAALKERALREERRLLYVAVTRARQHLIATAAHWYYPSDGFNETLKTPHGPSEFFEVIANHSVTDLKAHFDRPEDNSLVRIRDERAAAWPPAARSERPGFPEGIAAAVKKARETATEDPSLFPTRSEEAPFAPATLSATGVVTYTGCPKRFNWTFVRPLPRRSSMKARIGTEVHDWIAQRHDPQMKLLDDADLEVVHQGSPGKIASLRSAFEKTRFADRVARYIEHPFSVAFDDVVLQGRIDAIYQDDDGSFEIVDWKTGRAPDEHAAEDHQMLVYALSMSRLLNVPVNRFRTTFVYLGGEEVIEHSVDLGSEADIEARLRDVLASIRAGRFDATPSRRCGHCDFLHLCDEGRQHESAL